MRGTIPGVFASIEHVRLGGVAGRVDQQQGVVGAGRHIPHHTVTAQLHMDMTTSQGFVIIMIIVVTDK